MRFCLLYGSELWAEKKEIELRMERIEMKMIRWMVGVRLMDKVASQDLRKMLGLESMSTVLRRKRLGWFGHVQRKAVEECVKTCMDLKIKGNARRGRPKKTWWENVKEDMRVAGLVKRHAVDRDKWRAGVARIR